MVAAKLGEESPLPKGESAFVRVSCQPQVASHMSISHQLYQALVFAKGGCLEGDNTRSFAWSARAYWLRPTASGCQNQAHQFNSTISLWGF